MTKIIVFILIATALIGGGIFYNRRLDERAAREIAIGQEKIVQEQAKVLANLKIEDLVVGAGAEAKNGERISVNYEGRLADGSKFDSSYDRKKPFELTLGAGEVIKGWDLGVLGMKVGGKRKLVIPPELGYGSRAVGPIPANSTLYFTVELLSVGSATSR